VETEVWTHYEIVLCCCEVVSCEVAKKDDLSASLGQQIRAHGKLQISKPKPAVRREENHLEIQPYTKLRSGE
jgi:hypothetical protein